MVVAEGLPVGSRLNRPSSSSRQHRLRCGLVQHGSRRRPSQRGATSEEVDWRDFRARLLEREEQGVSQPDGSIGRDGSSDVSWAYASPLIEQGSLLLARPGLHFALRQQYFHKAVVLIVEHSSEGDVGIVLNRPTAIQTQKLGLKGPTGNIRFGGCCRGILLGSEDRQDLAAVCLHTCSSLKNVSTEVVPGIFRTDLHEAQAAVSSGLAAEVDFLTFVGTCRWTPGQLQRELDRGDTWSMAAVDGRTIVDELRGAQAEQPSGAGLAMWRRLWAALQDEARLEAQREGDQHADEVLRHWVRALLSGGPSEVQPRQGTAMEADFRRAVAFTSLRAGCVLWTSATAWVLGSPLGSSQYIPRRLRAAHYLHKAVLLLTEDVMAGSSAHLVMLNGPPTDQTHAHNITFGGRQYFGKGVHSFLGGQLRVSGLITLPFEALRLLILDGIFHVAPDIEAGGLLDAPIDKRWEVAGGRIGAREDPGVEALADVQRDLWFRRFMALSVGDREG